MKVFFLPKEKKGVFCQIYILNKPGAPEPVSLAQHIILKEGKTESLHPSKGNKIHQAALLKLTNWCISSLHSLEKCQEKTLLSS